MHSRALPAACLLSVGLFLLALALAAVMTASDSELWRKIALPTGLVVVLAAAFRLGSWYGRRLIAVVMLVTWTCLLAVGDMLALIGLIDPYDDSEDALPLFMGGGLAAVPAAAAWLGARWSRLPDVREQASESTARRRT
jgi:hypothetical protein